MNAGKKRGENLKSEKPESPACMLLGFSLGLALGGGSVHFMRIRQRRVGRVYCWTQSFHQWLEFILLQLKVQLHTKEKDIHICFK